MSRSATLFSSLWFGPVVVGVALNLLVANCPPASAQDEVSESALEVEEETPTVVPQQESVKIDPYTGPPIFLPQPAEPPPAIRVKEEQATDYYDPETKEKPRVTRTVRYYSDDTVKSHGDYTEYYENGQKFSEGRYDEGAPVGEWKYYHPDGTPAKTVTYADGRPDGRVEVHRADGTLRATRQYVEGQRDGDWLVYGDDGEQLLLESHYQQGKADGLWQVWFPNGQKRRQLPFVDGKQHGTVVEWDEEGNKRGEVNFEKGLREGVARLWTNDGRVVEQTYEEGRLVSTKSADN